MRLARRSRGPRALQSCGYLDNVLGNRPGWETLDSRCGSGVVGKRLGGVGSSLDLTTNPFSLGVMHSQCITLGQSSGLVGPGRPHPELSP